MLEKLKKKNIEAKSPSEKSVMHIVKLQSVYNIGILSGFAYCVLKQLQQATTFRIGSYFIVFLVVLKKRLKNSISWLFYSHETINCQVDAMISLQSLLLNPGKIIKKVIGCLSFLANLFW